MIEYQELPILGQTRSLPEGVTVSCLDENQGSCLFDVRRHGTHIGLARHDGDVRRIAGDSIRHDHALDMFLASAVAKSARDAAAARFSAIDDKETTTREWNEARVAFLNSEHDFESSMDEMRKVADDVPLIRYSSIEAFLDDELLNLGQTRSLPDGVTVTRIEDQQGERLFDVRRNGTHIGLARSDDYIPQIAEDAILRDNAFDLAVAAAVAKSAWDALADRFMVIEIGSSEWEEVRVACLEARNVYESASEALWMSAQLYCDADYGHGGDGPTRF